MESVFRVASVIVFVFVNACSVQNDDPCIDGVRIVKLITEESWCSAIVLRDGVALTAAHCNDPDSVIQDGIEVPVVATHSVDHYDVTILEAPGATKTWVGGVASGYGHGEEVVLEGFGCECAIRHGRARAVSGETAWPEGETNITTCPGDSGGAVFNQYGDLIGVTWGGTPGRSVFTRVDFIAGKMEEMGI